MNVRSLTIASVVGVVITHVRCGGVGIGEVVLAWVNPIPVTNARLSREPTALSLLKGTT